MLRAERLSAPGDQMTSSSSPVLLPGSVLPLKSLSDKSSLASNDVIDNSIEKRIVLLAKSNPRLVAGTDVSVNEWIVQFETNADALIALKLLECFEFYDIKRARSAFRKLHMRLLSRISGNEKNKLDKVAFLFAGNAKSGAMMGYIYSQANGIKVKGRLHKEMQEGIIRERFYPLDRIESFSFVDTLKASGVENLVLIDDIIINGGGIGYYLTREVREGFKRFEKVFLINLIANTKGLSRIMDGWPARNAHPIPNLEFIYDQEVLNFDDPCNAQFTDDEKYEIQRWLNKYLQIIDPTQEKKFDRSKSLVGFAWNIPGTTPMPFCYSTNKWKALFQRYSGEIVHYF